jgi:hypothetical protein
MADAFDALFDRMRAVQPPAPFAPATEVRRRGRQRTHRHRLAAAGGAALAVGGLGVGATVVLPHGSDRLPPSGPPTTAPASPSQQPSQQPSRPPGGRLLELSDLGPGWQRSTPEVFEGSDRWAWDGVCPAYESAAVPSLARRTEQQMVGFRRQYPEPAVVEIVERYAAGWGARNLDDVRTVIELCGRATPPPGEAPTRWTIEETGFAGDESLLVRHEAWAYQGEEIAPDPMVLYTAVVRVGDEVATIRAGTSSRVALELARIAALRLG